MSDSTAGTPAPETGAEDQGPRSQTGADPAPDAHAGDTLGAETPTGNDGTMGADATAGDAGLVEDPDLAAPEEGTNP